MEVVSPEPLHKVSSFVMRFPDNAVDFGNYGSLLGHTSQ